MSFCDVFFVTEKAGHPVTHVPLFALRCVDITSSNRATFSPETPITGKLFENAIQNNGAVKDRYFAVFVLRLTGTIFNLAVSYLIFEAFLLRLGVLYSLSARFYITGIDLHMKVSASFKNDLLPEKWKFSLRTGFRAFLWSVLMALLFCTWLFRPHSKSIFF